MSAERAWSFPTVEKTTAWKPEERGEAQIDLRDTDLETAQERTRLIREKMSPPEKLRLPPKLEAARQEYGIPDGFFRVGAGMDRIFVFPLDPFDDDEKIPGTRFYRANLTKQKDQQEGFRGVLISAGLTAMDRLMSHGYELGDIVMTNKNVPFARRMELLGGRFPMYVLVMRDGDLAGNETLENDIREGRARVVDVGGPEGYSHQIARLVDGQWVTSKKQSVYIQDCW